MKLPGCQLVHTIMHWAIFLFPSAILFSVRLFHSSLLLFYFILPCFLSLTACLFSRSNWSVTWENLSVPLFGFPSERFSPTLTQTHSHEEVPSAFLYLPPTHTLSGCLETLRKLAEVIIAANTDTVSKSFHNYTCSSMMLRESGALIEERFV